MEICLNLKYVKEQTTEFYLKLSGRYLRIPAFCSLKEVLSMQFLKIDENAFQCMVTTEDLQYDGMQIIDIITDKDKLSGLLFASFRKQNRK